MKTLIDIGIGFLLFIVQTLLQAPIISLFRDPFSGSDDPIPTLTYEYLLGAIVIFVISLGFALIFRTKDKARACSRAIIWTLTNALLTLGLAVINAVDVGKFSWSSLDKVVANSFSNVGFYALLLGIFLGPMVFACINKLI